MTTLLLDTLDWDLVIDAAGNIALASDPYASAQDAASAIRLFQGELYYDTTKGVPYWALILGKRPSISLIKQQFINAALTVPTVSSAQCFLSSVDPTTRRVSGQVQVKLASGVTAVAAFVAPTAQQLAKVGHFHIGSSAIGGSDGLG